MASPLPQPAEPGRSDVRPPEADPTAIRSRLSADVAAEFDREWEQVLEEAKKSKSLAGIRDLLAQWRHIAAQELRSPGSFHRLAAKADAIMATGRPAPGSVAGAEVRALISSRLAAAGLPDPRDGR